MLNIINALCRDNNVLLCFLEAGGVRKCSIGRSLVDTRLVICVYHYINTEMLWKVQIVQGIQIICIVAYVT